MLRIIPFALSLSKGEWKNTPLYVNPFMVRQPLGNCSMPDEAGQALHAVDYARLNLMAVMLCVVRTI